MNIADAIHASHAAYERQMRLFTAKSHDYASNADTLSNSKKFVKIAAALGLGDMIQAEKPEAGFLTLEVHKLVRWCNLRLQDDAPRCEAMQDTTDDAANYLRLAALALEEEEKADAK